MSNDISVSQRGHRLLWLVPLSLTVFGVGVFAWTSVVCDSASVTVTAQAAGLLALVDAVGLSLMLRFSRFDSPRDAVRPTLMVLGITLVVGALTIENLVGALDRGKQKRTMGDMRIIATAIESRHGVRADYPVTRPDDIEGLARELEPTYVKALPRLDGWGRPMRVESDGKSYTITSYGCCGEPDGPEVHVAPNGGTTTFRADIVFANGSFVKFPDGTQL